MAGLLTDNCPPFLRQCYAGLRSAADRLASGELRVRLGNGPLERLGQRAEGDLTMAATMALAQEPETYWDLSTRYVAAATSSLRDQMHERRIGRLVLFARLTAAAVEALFRAQWGTATARPPGLSDAAFAESLTCLYWSAAVYAELAGEHFGQDRGRPPLLRRAVPRRSRGSAGAGRVLGRAAGDPRPLPGPAGLGSFRPDRLEVREQKWKSSCPS